jgi:hypothetical protein
VSFPHSVLKRGHKNGDKMAPKTKTIKFRGTRYDARWVNQQVHPDGIMVLDERQLCPEIRMDTPGILFTEDKHILDIEVITVLLNQPFIHESMHKHENKGGWSLRQLFDVIEDDFRKRLHSETSYDIILHRMNPKYAITDLFYLMQAKITFGIYNNVVCTIENVK